MKSMKGSWRAVNPSGPVEKIKVAARVISEDETGLTLDILSYLPQGDSLSIAGRTLDNEAIWGQARMFAASKRMLESLRVWDSLVPKMGGLGMEHARFIVETRALLDELKGVKL